MQNTYIFGCLLAVLSSKITGSDAFAVREDYAQDGEDKDCNGFMDCTKCYGPLGCMSSGGNFLQWPQRPVSFLPKPRHQVNVKFQLLTRRNPTKYQRLVAEDRASVDGSNFRASQGVKFLIHGFIDFGPGLKPKEMARQLFQQGDFNVVYVDWTGGNGIPYTQAVANTRLVGAEIAYLVNWLGKEYGVKAEDVHVIGHSLGAQTAGYAGELIKNLGRITGLDPADPYFQGTHPEVRLDPTDALFVDVIHTDAKPFLTNVLTSIQGLGVWEACGHADFYVNGGKNQPGCEKAATISVLLTDGIVDGARHLVACNHIRAVDLFLDSINSDPRGWTAFAGCDNFDDFLKGRCLQCGSDGSLCSPLGYHAKQPPKGKTEVAFWSKTNTKAPFKRYHYKVTVELDASTSKNWQGDVHVRLHGTKANSDLIQLSEKQMLVHGAAHEYVLTTGQDLGSEIYSVSVRWECNSSMLWPSTYCTTSIWQKKELQLGRVTVSAPAPASATTFCFPNTSGKTLKSKETRLLHKATCH